MPPYQILDWDRHFENNRSRKIKHTAWVGMPNKFGGGYVQLIRDHPNGSAHFGVWCSVVELASRANPPRTGVLENGRKVPYTCDILALLTHHGAGLVEEAMGRFCNLGWTKDLGDIPHPGAEKAQEGAGKAQQGAEKTPRKGREGKGREEEIKRPAENKPTRTPALAAEAYWTRLGSSMRERLDILVDVFKASANDGWSLDELYVFADKGPEAPGASKKALVGAMWGWRKERGEDKDDGDDCMANWGTEGGVHIPGGSL